MAARRMNFGRKVLCALLTACGLAAQAAPAVKPAVEVFLDDQTVLVEGQRIGLITNPTGVDSQLNSTVDLFFRDPRVNLVALFGPEHGIRGNAEAGRKVEGYTDPATGLPVYSLYSGDGAGPSKEALDQVDVLVYNIQDIGCRSYTYVWTMAQCMQSAARNGKKFIVLDTPNPSLAAGMDGPMLDPDRKSFIGLYNVPYVYGLTAGELARYLNTEEKINCDLTVIPMEGYRRTMSWRDTGLPWVPTSPNIPSPEAAVCYTMTGQLGELYAINISIGWTLPFQVVGAPYLDADAMAADLNGRGLTGIHFRPIHYRPTVGVFVGEDVHGVQLHVTDITRLRPQEVGWAIMEYVLRRPEFQWPEDRLDMFSKSTGSKQYQLWFAEGRPAADMVGDWQQPLTDFAATTAPYLLYDK